MADQQWWTPKLHPDLSQGDVISDSHLLVAMHPTEYVKRSGGKASGWEKSEAWVASNDGLGHAVARGRITRAIVLTHSCELDKPAGRKRVLVAAVFDAASMTEAERAQVFGQKRFSRLPLPQVPGVGDCYVDLRLMMTIDRRSIEEKHRIAGMTDDGVQRLKLQLVGFLTRLGEENGEADDA